MIAKVEKLTKLKIRGKLSVAMVLVCTVPLIVSAVILHDMVGRALQDRTLDQLESLRSAKQMQIERYFAAIRDQVITLSQSRMLIDAANELVATFYATDDDGFVAQPPLQDMQRVVSDFYEREFASTYTAQNDGASVNLTGMIPADALAVRAQYHYIAGNPNPLGSKHKLDAAARNNAYDTRHAIYHPILRNLS